MTLKETISLFNYKVSEKAEDNIETLVNLMNSIPDSLSTFQPSSRDISLETVIEESREFMTSHFRLHSIRYLIEAKKTKREDGSFNVNLTGVEELDPYELPVEKCKNGESVCECEFFGSKGEYPETYFKRIKLNENMIELTPCILTHEIVHTQDGLREGILEYYTNIETLPIFLEVMHYVEKYATKENKVKPILRRLKHLVMYIDRLNFLTKAKWRLRYYDDIVILGAYTNKNSLKKEPSDEIIIISTYIESILKALNLFELYENSNINIRKQMIDYIQNIFDANRSVEDFLEFYDITFESRVDSLQKKLSSGMFS